MTSAARQKLADYLTAGIAFLLAGSIATGIVLVVAWHLGIEVSQ